MNQKIDIAIVGYGKMGKAFTDVARRDPNCNIFDIFDINPTGSVKNICNLPYELSLSKNLFTNPIVVDFTGADAFMNNLDIYTHAKLNAVVGSTGWTKNISEVTEKVTAAGTSLAYAGNFSLGVQSFYQTLGVMAADLSKQGGWDVSIIEEHHTGKKDSPSGTADEAAKIILQNMPSKTEVIYGNSEGPVKPNQLQISSVRLGAVFGTHRVIFEKASQRMELTHISQSREHFAEGALKAVQIIAAAKKPLGVINMQQLMMMIRA